MRLGVIARTEIARGLAIQTRNFVEHMPVERTLVIDMPRPDCAVDDSWCPNPTHIAYEPKDHTLDEATVREWLDGLDVVFTVETPYDWRMPHWAREMSVRLIVQGNPEFFRHDQRGYEHFGVPIWWWPTSWRLDHLPAGPVMPVPMPDVFPTAAHPEDGPLRVLHVIGKRAAFDRNGTDVFMRSLSRTRNPIEVTIHTIDGDIPDPMRQRNIKIIKQPNVVDDRWSMYANQHVLVLPRKYGGLCLPALEAAARGLAVVMPDASPNSELASVLTPVRREAGRLLNLACGPVKEAATNYVDLGETLDTLAGNRRTLDSFQQRSQATVPRWSKWRETYLTNLERSHW
jgi:hypothetical protein